MNSQRRFLIDSASKFTRIQLTDEEEKLAMQVSPLFLAFLQNKIEAYASALTVIDLPYSSHPGDQVKAIIALERQRSYLAAYEELMSELIQASSNQP